jgi:hypothetical protein
VRGEGGEGGFGGKGRGNDGGRIENRQVIVFKIMHNSLKFIPSIHI